MFIEYLNIFFLTKFQRKTKLAFSQMGWPHGLAHMAWSDPVGLGPVRTRPDHGPPDALPLLLSHPLSLSSRENAAASPPSPGCSQPSPAPARWFNSPPQSDLRLCPDRFDPRGLPCSPSTSELLVAAGQFGRRRCFPGRPALAMPYLNPPSSFLYTAAP
jgi:hypothetical protein